MHVYRYIVGLIILSLNVHVHILYMYMYACMHTLCMHFQNIDLMHMTSQRGAPACWGSNEALSRASSPKHAASGPSPACHTAGLARARALTERLRRQRALPAQHVPRSATSLAPQHGVVVMETWRQCIRSICRVHDTCTEKGFACMHISHDKAKATLYFFSVNVHKIYGSHYAKLK